MADVVLDSAQRTAVDLPHGRSLLVLGEAGHGKTTVAIHRLAHLVRTAKGRFRAVVIVPTEGLRVLLETIAKELHVDVPVVLYDRWAAKQARRVFPDAPKRTSGDATAGIIAFKRDPALRVALRELADRPIGIIDDDEDARPVETDARAGRGDLQHLFGDRALMEKVAAASTRPPSKAAFEELLEHTFVQFNPTSEESLAHVDEKRLKTVDRLTLDGGTPMADAGTVDVEDFAVLFELDRMRAERLGQTPSQPREYDCIVLDEAQEIAPLELALIGRSLSEGGSLVVAGDADQQLEVGFSSWEETMRELGCADYERRVLELGYRCPPAVVALAHRILGRGEATDARVASFESEGRLASWLVETLDATDEGNTAIVCRTALAARRISHALGRETTHRLVLDGDFVRGAPCYVTSVDQVKGLEFDVVIVPDVSAAAYLDTPASRRALYVAVTRARRTVDLACVGDASSIV
jgi:DNA helicase-2/ATP-dependent DNA helicase PcrA